MGLSDDRGDLRAPEGKLSREPRVRRISGDAIRRLHREEIISADEIRAILASVCERAVELYGGLNRLAERKRARVIQVGLERLTLTAQGFGRLDVGQMFLSFDLDEVSYFFVGVPLATPGNDVVEIEVPEVLYKVERRDLRRKTPARRGGDPRRVELRGPWGNVRRAEVMDWSLQGLGVSLREGDEFPVRTGLTVRFLDGEKVGRELHGVVRYRSPAPSPRGGIRLGLAVSVVKPPTLIEVERRERILEHRERVVRPVRLAFEARRLALAWAGGARRRAAGRASDVIDLQNSRGERIRALIDWTGEPRKGPLVLMPPAWGRTKETLLPLALTIVESFERAGRAATVLRFDGIRRRGESHNDPECLEPGKEHLRFTFSQAVEDIHAVLDFVESSESLRPTQVVLVTSSVAAVEGRRAIVSDRKKRVSGWISLVGISDLRSALWDFSGGVDYGSGVLSGVRFGVQELLGVACDIDLLCRDAVENGFWFLEDARREMAHLVIPITWIHGRDDGWMQLDRAREMLSCGDPSQRRLIEIPTGHQLRTGPEALEVFQLITREIARITSGSELVGISPAPGVLKKRQDAERRRLPLPDFDLRRFWRDYLVGRRGVVGIELLTATRAYQGLMDEQVELLGLRGSECVADLGSGAGDFPCRLFLRSELGQGLKIHSVDYVPEALVRGRRRLAAKGPKPRFAVIPIVANLSVGDGPLAVPFRSGSFDAVLASLLLGYLAKPEAALREIHRILKPKGRLVLSTLRRDADISKIYTESVAELQPDRVRRIFGEAVAGDIGQLRQSFLSDASRIIDLEEFGYFHFWDGRELEQLVAASGFHKIERRPAFGEPPQAVLITCRRS